MPKKNSDARARFAQRLRAIRIPRGFKTARSFAEALDIDENRYTRYERAEVEPDLQLLMKMCGLLGATPNDLLCDTIGSPPVDFAMPYGFADPGGNYQASPRPQSGPRAQPTADRLDEARKAAAWDLATVIAEIEAHAEGLGTLPVMEKLRRVPPIHARIMADVFQMLRELPDRLQGMAISTEQEEKIGRLTQQIIATGKAASNDNS